MKNEIAHSKKKILIIGASGHAKVIIDIVEREGRYTIFGLIDTYKDIGGKVFEYEILGTENDISRIVKENNIYGGIIAIGDNCTRKYMTEKISKIFSGFKYVKAIHPNTVMDMVL